MKQLALLFVFAFLVSCSTAATHVFSPISTVHAPTFTLKVPNDTENLSENISKRIQQLGFKAYENGDSAPDYTVLVDYKTYWDVVHQTFEYFVISFKDAKTNETRITSNYMGRVGFNGCNAAMDIVFQDIEVKLKK